MKEFRADAELTQEQLARVLGSTLRTVTRWESGEAQPTAGALIALADALSRKPVDFYVPKVDAA